MKKQVLTGLDLLGRRWPKSLNGCRIGLLAHPASVNHRFRHAVDIFLESKHFQLTALFGPQHGFMGQTQDNMVEWQSYRDRKTNLSVFSLYGATRKPSARMLKNIDVLAVDLQDVGARYYTFIWTLDLCMEAAEVYGIPVVVLDRPNPIGGRIIEGPVLDPEWTSFVGRRPLPVRHGMTIGEIALYLKEEFFQRLQLHVIKMEGWKRDFWFDETGLPWVSPSPNMPTQNTATVYPGFCLLEGTNISEGRGTTRPFEFFGAPFIDSERLVSHLKEFFKLPGVAFRGISFQPEFQKHAGKLCGGAQIHITSPARFKPFKTAVAVLKTIRELYPTKFRWKQPPYEYEKKKMPIDILAGSDRLRMEIDSGVDLKDMEAWWLRQIAEFRKNQFKKYRLY